MGNPEWYTGSDPSGRVAAGIESVIERMDARTADLTDTELVADLLALEQEINWRCFLQGLVGTIYYDLEEIDDARTHLTESVAGYEVYRASFDEVLSVYCQSCYTLGVILFDDGRYEDAVPCFLRCLPYMHEVYDETYIGNIHTFLALCLSWTNQNAASVVFSEAAVFVRRADCESLEQLMVAFGNAGENDKAADVFHLLQAGCQDYENFDRVLEYAEQNLGESGVVN
ncbi:MAG: tetratricopeptide repeat protein [Thermoanaerobaculales bacterium]|jgi:tetratricopeptide (TPR) repeat protein|nr:tetratricopeptide repeat protein [Thermoanaerobaculales bacterium]